ncbi:MAG: four helix bundle protein [Candidatus Levybacteria bacterium]|nr:four helix bundle protein [Candidatus Levybacteria bacterium]
MSTIWNVRQLRVYQRVLKLLPTLYDLVYSIPENHQKLRRQILSCGEGIAPLIAEGFAKRRNIAEFLRFLEMAMAESDELVTHIEQVKILSNRFKIIKIQLCPKLIQEYTIVSKELYNLGRNWNKFPKK